MWLGLTQKEMDHTAVSHPGARNAVVLSTQEMLWFLVLRGEDFLISVG